MNPNKVSVVYAEPQALEEALRGWQQQHPKARVAAAQPCAASDGSGKVIVTVIIWYAE